MPVGIGSGRAEFAGRPGFVGRALQPTRSAGPSGFHPLALWIAAASPVAATLLLLTRLAV